MNGRRGAIEPRVTVSRKRGTSPYMAVFRAFLSTGSAVFCRMFLFGSR